MVYGHTGICVLLKKESVKIHEINETASDEIESCSEDLDHHCKHFHIHRLIRIANYCLKGQIGSMYG